MVIGFDLTTPVNDSDMVISRGFEFHETSRTSQILQYILLNGKYLTGELSFSQVSLVSIFEDIGKL